MLKKFKTDLVHINPSLDRRSFYRDAVFIFIARLLNKKILVFFRGWLVEYEEKIKRSRLMSFIFKSTYAKADAFIILSVVFKNKLLHMGVSEDKPFFIESTVADSRYLEELDLGKKIKTFSEEIIFLFLSRIETTKGVYIAIDAFSKFVSGHPERKCRLIIAGDGTQLEPVKEYVQKKEIQGVEFTGYVSQLAKKEILLQSHIMIFPSYSEGLPNTILEGMVYGLPVISRATGGIPDIIKQGINGFLSESFDADIFSGFLEKLAYDKILYEKIACCNHNTAIQNYTTEKVKERIFKIYSLIT